MGSDATTPTLQPRLRADLLDVLAGFSPVDLEQLDHAQLHDRIESKIVLRSSILPDALRKLATDYFVLEHLADRIQGYANQYFDSAELRSYHEHHNQLGRRLKVRYRTYENSAMTFFEVKRKIAGRSVKERQLSTPPDGGLRCGDARFFAERTGWDPDAVVPSLTVDYQRILLVKRDFSERVTIDLELRFCNGTTSATPSGLAICELKQPRLDRRSPAMAAMKRRPETFSKYCIGMASCDPTLRRNRFKAVFRTLDSIGATPVAPLPSTVLT